MELPKHKTTQPVRIIHTERKEQKSVAHLLRVESSYVGNALLPSQYAIKNGNSANHLLAQKTPACPCMLFVGGLITGTQSWHTPKKCSRGPQRRVVSDCVSYFFLCTPVGSRNLFVVVDIIPKTSHACRVLRCHTTWCSTLRVR